METLAVITPFSEQWYSINFHLSNNDCFSGLDCVQNRLPLLTSINLNIYPYSHDNDQLQMFSVAPQLRIVKLNNIPLDRFNLPLNQLTRITTSIHHVDDCLDIFRHSPLLVNCSLDCSLFSNSADNIPHPVMVSSLESLYLGFPFYTTPLSQILEALTIPSLRNLYIRNDKFEQFPHEKFISLIDRSSCLLTSLNLRRVLISDTHLLHVLRAVPSLQILKLSMASPDSSRACDMLTPNSAFDLNCTNPLLPSLHTFMYSNKEIDFEHVAAMLISRWNLPTATASNNNIRVRLQTVNISVEQPHNLDSRTATILRQLRAEGMDIRTRPSFL
jgi:hypothetical protein